MHDTIERFQIGMNANSISHCGQALQSHSYFKCSVEGILPQLDPPNNRQRNNYTQSQNRQQGNCRQQQQNPRDRQQDLARRGSSGRESGPQPLVNEIGWI